MTGVPLHLFLTGEIQVGKSTIVSSVLSRLGVPVSGFRTVSVFRDGGESDVFLIPASGSLSDCCSASLLARRVPGRRLRSSRTVSGGMGPWVLCGFFRFWGRVTSWRLWMRQSAGLWFLWWISSV